MRKMRAIGIVGLLLCLGGPAGAAEDSAKDFLKGRQAELSGLVKTGGAAVNSKKIETVFDSILDYDALARGSLKDEWDRRSEGERKEFQDVLKQLVQRAYRKNLDRTANYEVVFDGEPQGTEVQVVKTTAQNRKNAREEPITIDYVVHKVGGTWRIRDIVTEGTSLVNNYHQQFTRIIKKDGFDQLMKKMRNKLSSGAS